MRLARFSGLDGFSRESLRRLAENWRESPARPCVSGKMALAWHQRVSEWVNDPDAPLLVRYGKGHRGEIVPHPCGRVIVIVDDAPAYYFLSLALEERLPTVAQLRRNIEEGRFPVARSLTQAERFDARYSGTLDSMDAPDLRELGYALCHVTQIGLRRGTLIERSPVELLAHSLLLLSPINSYVVPRQYGGLGELPEFVDEMDDARSFAASWC